MNLRDKNIIGDFLANLGLVAIMAAMSGPVLHCDARLTRWVFTAATAIYTIGRILAFRRGDDVPVRVTRLRRIEMWSAVMFVTAAVFMWLRNVGHTDWVAFTLAGAVLVIYTSIAIPAQLRKTKSEKPD